MKLTPELPPAAAPWVVYILCYPEQPLHARHYIGITTPARLQDRLREHRTGRGARTTAKLNRNSNAFYLAGTLPATTRRTERRLIKHHRESAICPRCLLNQFIDIHRVCPQRPPLRPTKSCGGLAHLR